MASKFFSIIVGAGSGTGRAVAKKFGAAYPVVVLARRPESYGGIVKEIQDAGGKAYGVSADAADAQSMDSAFESITKEMPGCKLVSAVYNVSAGFAMKPFLEMGLDDYDQGMTASRGFFTFAQKTLPLLVETASEPDAPHPPTLILTGATASLKGSAKFSTFAAAKFAQRAMAQSMAREFGPRGVHVAHAVVDGVIDIERSRGWQVNGGVEDGKLKPEAIAESYWFLANQHRSAFTQELDLRPFVEKF